MRLTLHPDQTSAAITAIEATWLRAPSGVLALRYLVRGDIANLLVAAADAPARTDELWKQTCFEAFVRPAGGEAYYEFNFAPSTRWAAYRFDGYRAGMREALYAAPRIATSSGDDRYELHVTFDLPEDARGAARLGLSAVIEEADGAKSYWALVHPPGKPDFHHAANFALDLPEHP